MKTRFIVRSLVSVFALTAAVAFADAQSDLESKIANEVAGKYRAITAKANSLDAVWIARQAEKAAAAKDSSVGKDIVFLGDDAMAGWETTGAGAMSAFGSAKIFNLGYKGDCTEHVLWRVTEGGELSGYTAKAVVFTVGANNSAVYMRAEEAPVATLYAIIHTLAKIRAAQPNATIIVNSILPRGANASDDVRRRIGVLNEDLRKWVVEKGSGYVWCDLTDTFVDKANGDALKAQYFESDKVSLNASGYAAWAAVLDDYVAAAANGTAMPANLVCERRPLQGSAPDSTYGTSRTYPGLGYWDKLANFLYGNGVQHQADVVLLGDSITEKWAGPEMSSSMYSLGDKVMNLGNSGDMTENLLWRLENGELEGYTTKIFNLLIGTNNTQEKDPLDSPEDIAAGVRKIIDLVLEKHPESKITLVPILPFGHVSRPDWGRMLNETNQAANAIISTFADNQRVFLVDIDNSKFYNQDGTFNAQMYVGDEAALHYLHLSAKGYSEIVAPAVKAAIAAAGETGVAFPSVGSVSATVSGTKATLTVSDIAKGTTKSGVAASSATVFCKLDSAAGTSCAGTTVALADLADGPHTCAVWVENEDGLVSAPKRVTFAVNSKENEVGWSIAPMDSTGTGFRSSGTTVFANGYGYSAATVNGVEFSFSTWLPSEDKVSFSSAQAGHDGWGENNPIFAGGWYWNKTADASMDLTATFKGLTAGHKYVAQMLVSYLHSDSTKVMSVSAGELAPVTVSDSGDCKYGAIVTRVFVASGATEDVKITIDGGNSKLLLKAIQLRDLGEGGEEDPTQEDDPVDPPAGTAWIPDPVPGSNPASEPCIAKERTDDYHKQHFAEDLSAVEKSHKKFDVVLFGDSITDFWVNPNLSLDEGLTNTVNMGIGSDRTQNLLWRVRNGALDGYTTKYLTLLIGVNNSHQKRIDENIPCDRPEDIADSIRLILNEMVAKHPESKILLMPIIPYCYDSRYYDGLEVRNTNEDVNDYIIKFVDNKRIFWVDFRRQFLNSDATCNHSWYRDGGNPGGGYDAVGTCLHPAIASYSDIFKPALSSAIQKYLAVPAGTAQVADPSLGYASAAPDGMDQSATITVCGIFLGTDSSAKPVTSYTLAYDLDDGTKTGELTNQTLTRNSFKIADVGPGDHTCAVTITTADGKVLTTSVDFAMTEGWTGAPLPADSGAVRTDGTLKYAYAIGNYTVNTVPFTRAYGAIGDNIDWPYTSDSGSSAPAGVEAGGYSDLLTHCWWANQGEKTVTLKNLTIGENYLVQIFGYRNWDGFDKAHVWIKESFRDVNFIRVMGDGWTYGGVLTGVFTATAETKTFTIAADSNYAVNGIQVRDIGQGTIEPIPVNPSVGSLTASVNGSTATISLKNIVKGTDDEAVAATSYSVSYSLTNAAAVVALSDQSAATAEFSLTDLADGDYTCSVTITTDKGKTSVAKSVNFTIKTSTPGGDDDPDEPVATGWTSGPMAADGSTIRKDGTLVYAYNAANANLEINEVQFAKGYNWPQTADIECSVAPTSGKTMLDAGLSGNMASLMREAWTWNVEGNEFSVVLTLKGLTKGKTYLCQLVSHSHWAPSMKISANNSPAHTIGNDTYGASVVGVFVAKGDTETVTVTFTDSNGDRPINAIQVRELSGSVDPVDPEEPLPVYTLTIPAQDHLSVESVKTNNVSVTGSEGAYSIVSNTQVTITFAAATGYQITAGNPVVVTVESNMTLAQFPTVQEKQGGDDPDEPVVPTEYGWKVNAMTAAADLVIEKQGTFLYGYRGNSSALTVDEVMFAAGNDAANMNIAFSSSFANAGENSGSDFGTLLATAWNWGTSQSAVTVTFNGLTKDHVYLVQILAHNGWGDPTITVGEETPVRIGSGAKAANIVGTFKANGTSAGVELKFGGGGAKRMINAIQVRDLGEGGDDPVTTVDPSIGSLTASVNGTVVTISLADIVFGTDDDGESATSCSVYYSVTNSTGSEIKSGTVKNGLSAQTYAFDLNDFEDGDYTCGVRITTDKGKTAAKTVNFTVKTSTPGGDDDPDEPVAEGWAATPMSETGDTIRKDGELCYSYARRAVTVNSVAFEALGDVNLQDVRNSKKFAFSGDMNRDMNSDVVDPYANMLQHRFVGTTLSQTLTLKELTAGKNYLVQLVLCFPDGFAGGTMVTAPDGKTIAKANGSGWENGGSLVGVFTATNSTVTFDLTFEKYACMNAIQVRELSGSVDPVDPEEPLPVYTLTIPAQDHLSVESVKTNNVAVSGSGNDYSIVSNTEVTIAFAAETGYEITGGNPVVVTVESNMTLAEFPTVQEKQGGDDPVVPIETGWTAVPLTASESSVCTTGTVVYAYCESFGNNYKTNLVNGVPFCTFSDNGDFAGKQSDVIVSPAFDTWGNGFGDEGVDGNYGNILKSGFRTNDGGSLTYTLKNLTAGKNYLVQLFVHWNWAGSGLSATIGDKTVYAGGSGWTYGGSLIGVFNATGTDYSFTVDYTKYGLMNAIQVRELPAGEPIVPADAPIIGGEGVDVPMAVSSDTVSITISNAAVGHTYGYKKSVTLEGLATAEVIKLDSPAAAAGILTLDIPKDPEEPTCFYQIVVE